MQLICARCRRSAFKVSTNGRIKLECLICGLALSVRGASADENVMQGQPDRQSNSGAAVH